MDKLCVYVDFDVVQLDKYHTMWGAFKKLKTICEDLNFKCIEPGVWEFQGDPKQALAQHALLTTRFEQFDIMKLFKEYLVRFSNGEIEDCLEAYNEAHERAEKLGWLDENGKIIPLHKANKK